MITPKRTTPVHAAIPTKVKPADACRLKKARLESHAQANDTNASTKSETAVATYLGSIVFIFNDK